MFLFQPKAPICSNNTGLPSRSVVKVTLKNVCEEHLCSWLNAKDYNCIHSFQMLLLRVSSCEYGKEASTTQNLPDLTHLQFHVSYMFTYLFMLFIPEIQGR